MIDSFFQELLLAGDNRITHLHDGLLSLLDVLDELNGALVALLHIITRVFVIRVAGQEALVGRVQAKLGSIVVIHQAQPLVAMFNESDVGLNQPRLHLVVAQSRTRIESTDIIERLLHHLNWTAYRLADFLVLFHLQGTQMLVNNGNRIVDDLSRGFSMVVFQMWNLLLLVSQLVQQAVTQVAAGNSRRIHLSHYFDGFGEIRAIKAWLIRGPRRRRICRWRRGC